VLIQTSLENSCIRKGTTLKREESPSRFNRRRFLTTTAATGGSLILSQSTFAQSETTEGTDIQFALIGAGAQGQALLNTCMKTGGLRCKAICDIWKDYNLDRASRILTGYGQEHNTYVDYRDLLEKEKDLDAVIIATPDFCHAEQSVACLDAGLNVYCESVMSNSIDGARQMLTAAKETGKLLQIGCQRRSNPRYRHAYLHLINETKLLGEITAVNGQWNRPVQQSRGWPRRAPVPEGVLKQHGYESMEQFRNWRWYRDLGGGPVADLGSHQIDVFNWYMGTLPKSVTASGGTEYYDPETHQWPDTVMAIYEYEFGKKTIRAFYQTINANSCFGSYENFMGDEGTLHLSETGSRVTAYREPSAPDWDRWVRIGFLEAPEKKEEETEAETESGLDVEESVEPPSYKLPLQFNDPVHKPHLDNFFNAVRGGEQLNYPVDVAYPSTVAVLKIYDAIREGGTLEFKPEDFQV